MNTQLALGLPATAPSNTVVINARCTLRAEGDQRVIVVGGLAVHHYYATDTVAEAYAIVMLVQSGFAQQTEVAHAFGMSDRTVRRYQERYEQAGMVGLGRTEGWRAGRRRISGRRLRIIESLKGEGLSNRAIAQRLGVNEKAIRKLVGWSKGEELEQFSFGSTASPPVSELRSAPTSTGLSERRTEESVTPDPRSLPQEGLSQSAVEVQEGAEESEALPMSLDQDAGDRILDRQLAHAGWLDDAAPIFRDGWQVVGAGVLLAIPFLVHSGVLRIARKLYGEIGPAFYGLRTTLMTLFLMRCCASSALSSSKSATRRAWADYWAWIEHPR